MAANTAGGRLTKSCEMENPKHFYTAKNIRIHPTTTTTCDGSLMRSFPPRRFCGSYVGHHTVFRISDHSPEVEFRCSSRVSAQPFQATYSSYNISQRKPCWTWRHRQDALWEMTDQVSQWTSVWM